MKQIAFIAVTVLAFLLPWQGLQAQPKEKKGAQVETVVFSVNVHCDNCKAKLEKKIPFEKGVKDMDVDLENQMVTVKFDTRKNDAEAIAKAIGDLGYTVEIIE
ncbi:MAG: heavy-metal-associated domain-containing protein [Alistipes sp.]|nr:heavy-metal-associated domain-containing protein [Alistipes sp.]